MSGQQDSNLRSPAPKAGALPTGPCPERARRYNTPAPGSVLYPACLLKAARTHVTSASSGDLISREMSSS